jgi:phenylalanyl-tRNA synthetase alpha chain
MNWNFEEITKTAEKEAQAIIEKGQLEAFRIKYLGRKGLLSEMYAALSSSTKDEKPLFGKNINILKSRINQLIAERGEDVQSMESTAGRNDMDVTLPGIVSPLGHQHLIAQTIQEICGLFETMGFVVKDGPEIETEFNNFTALNIPVDHPSRDAFDTFYLDQKNPDDKDRYLLLRSHTSPGQIRIMKDNKPPLAVVIPGRVYRPDAVDASHSFMFHQIEGLLVDQNVRFSDLKGLLTHFCKKFFGEKTTMRFRPHFFPFTEPSAEVDISWVKGKKKWLEIMGCGLVHPQVFKSAGYPDGKYTGLAFGMGVERIAMLRHGIQDIRTFFDNDARFLKQF